MISIHFSIDIISDSSSLVASASWRYRPDPSFSWPGSQWQGRPGSEGFPPPHILIIVVINPPHILIKVVIKPPHILIIVVIKASNVGISMSIISYTPLCHDRFGLEIWFDGSWCWWWDQPLLCWRSGLTGQRQRGEGGRRRTRRWNIPRWPRFLLYIS